MTLCRLSSYLHCKRSKSKVTVGPKTNARGPNLEMKKVLPESPRMSLLPKASLSQVDGFSRCHGGATKSNKKLAVIKTKKKGSVTLNGLAEWEDTLLSSSPTPTTILSMRTSNTWCLTLTTMIDWLPSLPDQKGITIPQWQRHWLIWFSSRAEYITETWRSWQLMPSSFR